MRSLFKFNLNSFSVKNKENKPFSDVLEETQKGKFNYDYNDNAEKKASAIAFIIEVIFFIVVVCLISVFVFVLYKTCVNLVLYLISKR